jgi:hypothetical protein
MKKHYTWGLKSRTGDTIICYNVSQEEAERMAKLDPQFIAVPISTHKLPPRVPYIPPMIDPSSGRQKQSWRRKQN